jgi:hypothetical protein
MDVIVEVAPGIFLSCSFITRCGLLRSVVPTLLRFLIRSVLGQGLCTSRGTANREKDLVIGRFAWTSDRNPPFLLLLDPEDEFGPAERFILEVSRIGSFP